MLLKEISEGELQCTRLFRTLETGKHGLKGERIIHVTLVCSNLIILRTKFPRPSPIVPKHRSTTNTLEKKDSTALEAILRLSVLLQQLTAEKASVAASHVQGLNFESLTTKPEAPAKPPQLSSVALGFPMLRKRSVFHSEAPSLRPRGSPIKHAVKAFVPLNIINISPAPQMSKQSFRQIKQVKINRRGNHCRFKQYSLVQSPAQVLKRLLERK